MSTVTLALVLFGIAVLLYVDAPRQARRLIERTDPDVGRESDPGRLGEEMTFRLRAAAIGSAAGTFGGLLVVLLGGGAGETDGPGGVLDVALLITPTVVASVAAETATILRRTPSPTGGTRTASLQSRVTGSTRQHAGEITLVVLAAASFGLAVASIADDVAGARGAIAAAVGALVVMVTCLAMRARLTTRAVVAQSSVELAVDSAAGAATQERIMDNFVANGAMLTLVALLVPVLGSPGTLRTIGLLLALAVLVAAVAAVLARRGRQLVTG